MKKPSIIIFLIALLAAGLILSQVSLAATRTIYVDGSDKRSDYGGCGSFFNPCNTIQKGIDQAAPGDTVLVAAGTYFEAVIIDKKKLTLLGKGKVVIDPEICEGCADPKREEVDDCMDAEDEGACNASWQLFEEEPTSCVWVTDGESLCFPCAGDVQDETMCENTCEPHNGITITEPWVTVQNVEIRNGNRDGIKVEETATGARILEVKISGPNRKGISIDADKAVVAESLIRGCGQGCIDVNAQKVTIKGNTLRQCGGGISQGEQVSNGGGIDVVGDDAKILDNNIHQVQTEGVFVVGDSAEVTRNVIVNSDGEGIQVSGNDFRISHNHVGPADNASIRADCLSASCPARTIVVQLCGNINNETDCNDAFQISDGAESCIWDDFCSIQAENECPDPPNAVCTGKVTYNEAFDNPDDECFAFNEFIGGNALAGLLVTDNRAVNCNDEGFRVDGKEVVLIGNKAIENGANCSSEIGAESGFRILGSKHTLKYNLAEGNMQDGFNIQGVDITCKNNVAEGNLEDGFDVEEGSQGIVLSGNKALNNNLLGFEINEGAQVDRLTFNRAWGNRIDFCNEGTIDVKAGNKFGTRGPCCEDCSDPN